METIQNKSFGFTAKVDEKNLHKVLQFRLIKELLNKHLNLSDYTKELSEIVFVYLASSPEISIPEKDFKKYRRKHKCLEIGVNIDYQCICKADKENSLKILAETYLKGIKTNMRYKDFDHNKFYKDVKQLFVDNKLITLAVENIRDNLIRKIERIEDKTLIFKLEKYLDNALAKAV